MKKLVCALLVCVMFCMSAVAFAAVPSKTTQDMASVVKVETATDVAVGEGFVIKITEEQEYATTELKTIAAFIQETGETGETGETEAVPVIKYFTQTEAVEKQVAELLPEDFDEETLVMYEFAPLTAVNYDTEYGDVTGTMVFATKYRPEQTLLAMVGIVTGVDEEGNQIVEWTALKAEAIENEEDPENGYVRIHFPKELLPKIESGEAMVAILSDEIVEEVTAEE